MRIGNYTNVALGNYYSSITYYWLLISQSPNSKVFLSPQGNNLQTKLKQQKIKKFKIKNEANSFCCYYSINLLSSVALLKKSWSTFHHWSCHFIQCVIKLMYSAAQSLPWCSAVHLSSAVRVSHFHFCLCPFFRVSKYSFQRYTCECIFNLCSVCVFYFQCVSIF